MRKSRAKISKAGIDRERRRGPKQRISHVDRQRPDLFRRRPQDHRADRDHLQHSLEFGDSRHRHADRRRCKEFPQSPNQDFSGENYKRGHELEPKHNVAGDEHHHMSDADQYLVGNRVEHAAEFRLA